MSKKRGLQCLIKCGIVVVTMKPRTVSEIIDDCGGAPAIAEASTAAWVKRAGGKRITAKGVYKWAQIGIPSWHWPLVIKLCGATADELYQANAKLSAAESGLSKVA